MEIVGGGPAGLYTAYLLAKGGEKARVYEEHHSIGEPSHCAGLISRRLSRFLGDGDFVLQKVDGAKIVCGDRSFRLKRRDVAYVVDRPEMDRTLGEMAESEGAEIVLGRKASISSLESPFVDASGTASEIRSLHGLGLKTLPALQYLVDAPAETVEVHITPLAPDFFAWVIPVDGKARVGMASSSLPLDAFVKKRFGSPKVLERSAGTVVVNGPLKRTVFGEGILVGDAAGQVKATTGGGVVAGLTAAQCAANSILEGDIASYEKRWREEIGWELEVARLLRRFVDRVDHERFFDFSFRNAELLEKRSDMDFHSGMVKALLSRPSNWLSVASLFWSALF